MPIDRLQGLGPSRFPNKVEQREGNAFRGEGGGGCKLLG